MLGGEISVFWDVEDSSILNDLNPNLMYQNIKSALREKGYFGHLSIILLVDDKNTLSEELLNEYLKAVIFIYSLPKGEFFIFLFLFPF